MNIKIWQEIFSFNFLPVRACVYARVRIYACVCIHSQNILFDVKVISENENETQDSPSEKVSSGH